MLPTKLATEFTWLVLNIKVLTRQKKKKKKTPTTTTNTPIITTSALTPVEEEQGMCGQGKQHFTDTTL